jgi:hypothetical protein
LITAPLCSNIFKAFVLSDNNDVSMDLQEGVMPRSFHIEVDQQSADPTSESEIEYVLKPTDTCRKELSLAGFKKNIESLMEGLGSIRKLDGMRAQVVVQEHKDLGLASAIEDKTWLQIE